MSALAALVVVGIAALVVGVGVTAGLVGYALGGRRHAGEMSRIAQDTSRTLEEARRHVPDGGGVPDGDGDDDEEEEEAEQEKPPPPKLPPRADPKPPATRAERGRVAFSNGRRR